MGVGGNYFDKLFKVDVVLLIDVLDEYSFHAIVFVDQVFVERLTFI